MRILFGCLAVLLRLHREMAADYFTLASLQELELKCYTLNLADHVK